MVEYTEKTKGKRKLRVSFAVSEQDKTLVEHIKTNIDMDSAFKQILHEDIVPQILESGVRTSTKDKIKEIMGVD